MSLIHIVGAGPAGSIAALSAINHGHSVVISEEHKEAGWPVTCSGLLSAEGLDSLSRFVDYRKSIINSIKGADIYFSNQVFKVRAPGTVAYVCDRTEFDARLAKSAETEGARINYKERIDGGFKADCVIGADGPHSHVASHFGFPQIRKYVCAMKALVAYDNSSDMGTDILKMYLSNERFPGFFGWVIPHSRDIAEFGVGVSLPGDVKKAWERLLDMHGIFGPQAFFADTIPMEARAKAGMRKNGRNVLLVGDAAGHTKPTSVDYTESILINQNGLLRNECIGEFVNKRLDDSNFLITRLTPGGYKETYVLGDVYGAAVNNGFKTISSPITRVLKHATNEMLYEIQLKNGFRVKTTGSHSVVCLDNFSMVEKEVGRLKVDDHLLVSLNVPNNENLCEINLVKMILEEAPHLIKNIRVRGARELLFKKSTEIDRRYRSAYWGRNSIPLSKFLEKGAIPHDAKLVFEPPGKKVEINNIIKVNDEFARLLGYIIAEACIRKNDATLIFGKEDVKKGLIKDAIRCIKNVFGIVPQKPRSYNNPLTGRTSSFQIAFGGRLLALILSDVFKTGKGARSKRIPFPIFNVENQFKREFLKAYLLGDGTIRIRTPKKRRNWSAEISAKTASYKLASDLVLLGIQLGLLPTIQSEKGSEHFWNKTKIKSGPSYRICFTNKKNLIELSDVFPERKNELKEFLRSTGKRTSIGLPKKYFENEFIRTMFLEYGGKKYRKNYHSYETYPYDLLEKIVDDFKGDDPRMKVLKKIVKEKLYLVSIKEIKRMLPTTGEVFDIEVDKTHTFLGGLGPIVLHNTGGGVIFGGKCAAVAGRNADSPNKYEIEWRTRYGPDLFLHRAIRDYLDSLDDRALSSLGRKLNSMKIDDYLSAHGSMDSPTKMMTPSLILHGIRAIAGLK